ncbi:MAG: type II transport protein GspH [Saccharospirillaceae bacterium]|nr:GspH/FimT family pseudopilin [Pseudomonadales bacterium]NRB77079.1 type II transport protein GspH [Saccharospirillaceae bacterium]
MKIWNYRYSAQKQITHCGFTIIEFMAVIAITAILATASIPSYSSYLSDRKIQLTQQSIFSTLRQIRLQAITQAQSIVMCSSVDQISCSKNTNSKDWSAGWIVFVDLNNNKKRDVKNEDILILQSINKNQNIVWNRGGYLVYNYEGKVNQNGSFFICAVADVESEKSRSIIINRVGRPYLSKLTSNDKLIVC